MRKVILTTSGVYSDYRVLAIFDWLSDKTPEEAREIYLNLFPEEREKCKFDAEHFVGWLAANIYAEDIEAEELHLDNYGCIDNWQRETLKIDR